MKLAVILPAFNEALTIEPTVRSFHKSLPEAAIYVVDNNSIDDTAEIAKRVLKELGVAGQLISESRQGKGNALRRAFTDVEADVYLLSDADMTYPSAQARELIKPILEGKADMVVGDRHSAGHYHAENKRPLHGFGNKLVRDLVNYLFDAQLADIMSGYRVFTRRFVKSYPILVEGFEIETDMTLHALDKRFRIVEVSVEYQDRPEGSFSKLDTLGDGLRVMKTISRILRYYKPLKFFGIISVVFSLLAIAAGVPVFEDWIRDQYIHHVPLAILATGLMVISFLLFAIGLILDSISHQDRSTFERDLIEFSGDSLSGDGFAGTNSEHDS